MNLTTNSARCCLLALLGACTISGPGRAGIEWTPQRAAELEARIAAGEFGTVTSVLILDDGAIVYEGYFNGADAATLHDTRSVTKTITGMVAGIAIGEGLLRLDAPLAPLFADLAPFADPDPRKDAVTALDLLTMSSVMECNDWNEFSRGNEERMYLVEDWTGFFWDLPIRGFPAWTEPPGESPHGRAFSYCTAGVQLLGEAIGRTAGTDFTAYAEDRLFAPLGVSDFEWARNAQGQAHMGGGLRLTTRALARFGELQRLGGEWQGEMIFPRSWAAASVSEQAVIPGTDFGYGYLWWLAAPEGGDGPVEVAAMNGNGGNRVWVVPEFGLTVVLTKTDYNMRGMHEQAAALFEAFILPNLRED